MNPRIGVRVKSMRERRGWTQEHLADASALGLRTVQRIESDRTSPSAETLQAMAAAFGCDVDNLLRGLTSAELTALQDDFLCPHCGARMIEQTTVPHEYGDSELEIFACGFMRGWKWRPCPKDPRFPKFEDYELRTEQDAEGVWTCYALGRTSAAQAVSLKSGRARSDEVAIAQVAESYRAAARAARAESLGTESVDSTQA